MKNTIISFNHFPYIKYLHVNPHCAAVTGRRIAQSQHQQTDPFSNCQEDGWTEGMLRATQSHLFETENKSMVEYLFGCVPILHGHCTFINWARVQRSAFVDLYFRLAYKSPSEVGFFHQT